MEDFGFDVSSKFRMSDDEREMDMDSEDDDFGDDDSQSYADKNSGSGTPNKPMTQAEKRAHHNMLERKRRDHIKDSFVSLRDSVPALQGEKSSRAQILKKAAEYIQFMRRKNSAHQHDIEDLRKQNTILENQIRSLERARLQGGGRSASGNPSATSPIDIKSSIKNMKGRSSESDNSDGEFHMTSSPESATSSNTSAPIPVPSSGTKKLKALHTAK